MSASGPSRNSKNKKSRIKFTSEQKKARKIRKRINNAEKYQVRFNKIAGREIDFTNPEDINRAIQSAGFISKIRLNNLIKKLTPPKDEEKYLTNLREVESLERFAELQNPDTFLSEFNKFSGQVARDIYNIMDPRIPKGLTDTFNKLILALERIPRKNDKTSIINSFRNFYETNLAKLSSINEEIAGRYNAPGVAETQFDVLEKFLVGISETLAKFDHNIRLDPIPPKEKSYVLNQEIDELSVSSSSDSLSEHSENPASPDTEPSAPLETGPSSSHSPTRDLQSSTSEALTPSNSTHSFSEEIKEHQVETQKVSSRSDEATTQTDPSPRRQRSFQNTLQFWRAKDEQTRKETVAKGSQSAPNTSRPERNNPKNKL